ncbi:sugar ABC transporter ATP-binding protein [Fuerstiella marisgermanici]|uniref:Ribose import ATP-binding protein RbsA n=1 Tax=Fuerstiella marisgermanici TaxID=1891926 RepID=A0A1P8WS29_9PLAN|nr:sugar ABC transporter ATP-binding protein [Fuerstiella marisgermanici]APZ96866.1 Ribose import ATP-binding protein RbsA [Fuerstiella marisgermanici]
MTEGASPHRLQVCDVCKTFPGVRALHKVNLHVAAGELLSVIGENGAGKSTLMKILAGVQNQDSGRILVEGKPQHFRNVSDALNNGIALIHQELNLADNLEVGANIFLGREPLRRGLIDEAKINAESEEFLRRVGLTVSPQTLVRDLTIGQQQLVEIAKAVSIGARVLIMDEPTSSLSAGESERLFEVIRDLRSSGVSILYISHRLAEVQDLSDRVTVLRDGENAGDLSRDEVSHDKMVQLMVGRDVSRFYSRQPHDAGDVAIEVHDLITPTWPAHALNFRVSAGEIVGVAGLVGAGRTEMLRTLFGVDRPLAGRISVDGKPVQLSSPQDAIEAGIALVPEDRKQQGLVLEMIIRRNVGLAALKRNAKPGGFVDFERERADSAAMVDRLRVKTPDDLQVVGNLSGGNQQKVVLGKWLILQPKVLLLDEPTRGIDVGAKQEIYQLMDELAGQGMAILFVSSEMEEVIGMSDRAIVMHEGRITGELQRDELTEEAVMQLATGAPEAAVS